MFGFFETVDDPRGRGGAARRRRASGLRERGRERMLGPMDFTTNDEVGILIEGYELRPMILQNWHPPYYKELLEAHGFGKAMDLLMWDLELGELKEGEQFDPAIHAAAEKALRDEGVAIRNIDKRQPGERDAPLQRGLQRGLGRQLGLRPGHRRRDRVPRQDCSSRCSTRTGPSSPKRTARWSAPPSPCPTSTRCWRR